MLHLVPSRGRPGNVKELIESWEATRSEARMWICVDEDDQRLGEYRALKLPEWASLLVAERLRLGGTLNYWSELAITMGYTMIGFMGDDHRPRTKHWDLSLIEAANTAGGTAVVYGNDLLQGVQMATAVAMTANIPETLGYMVPPGLTHLYMDSAWLDMGRAAGGLVYMPHVIIEHMHPVAQKAQWDEGYAEVNSDEMYRNDRRAYDIWLADPAWREKLSALKAGA